MADNLAYTPGSGATIASDEIGGAHHQRVKIVHGADGTATDTSENTPLPTTDGQVGWLLRRIFDMLSSPMGFDRSLSRQRSTAIIESGTVNVGTVTTVAGLTNIDGRNGSMLINQTNLDAWAACVRSRIT